MHTEAAITIPAQSVTPFDLLDTAIDMLIPLHIALSPEADTWRDKEAMTAIWATMEEALKHLQRVRDHALAEAA